MDDNLKQIGNRLKSLRKCVNLSRKEVETQYGLSQATLTAWEMGKSDIGVVKLCNYLKFISKYGISVSIDAIVSSNSEIEIKRVEKFTI